MRVMKGHIGALSMRVEKGRHQYGVCVCGGNFTLLHWDAVYGFLTPINIAKLYNNGEKIITANVVYLKTDKVERSMKRTEISHLIYAPSQKQ